MPLTFLRQQPTDEKLTVLGFVPLSAERSDNEVMQKIPNVSALGLMVKV